MPPVWRKEGHEPGGQVGLGLRPENKARGDDQGSREGRRREALAGVVGPPPTPPATREQSKQEAVGPQLDAAYHTVK